jgi:hypothetical protein
VNIPGGLVETATCAQSEVVSTNSNPRSNPEEPGLINCGVLLQSQRDGSFWIERLDDLIGVRQPQCRIFCTGSSSFRLRDHCICRLRWLNLEYRAVLQASFGWSFRTH